MFRKSIYSLFAVTLLFVFSTQAYADPATVSNNGNTRVRVQYKTPAGDYQDMYLNPGETKTLPGGVEKVKLVREIGEWASPLPAGVTLEVEVKAGDQTVGKSTWYGEKVFFDELTEAPPETAVSVPPAAPAAGEIKETPKTQTTVPAPESPKPLHWPWFMFFQPWQIFTLLALLMIPFILALGRSFARPGWRTNGFYPGFNPLYVLIGLTLGFALGFFGFWGHRVYGEEPGLLSFFAMDLFTFPLFFLVFLGKMFGAGDGYNLLGAFPHPLFIILFWMIVCGGLGCTVGTVRSPILHSLAGVMALIPLLIFTKGGCMGRQAFAWQEPYQGALPLYPGAFSSLILIPLLFVLLLSCVRPYHGYVNGYSGYAAPPRRPLLGLGCLPLLVLCLAGFLFGGIGLWGYEAFSQTSLIAPLFGAIVSVPVMLNFPILDPRVMIFIFWALCFGGIGCALGCRPYRRLLIGSMLPSLIALIILINGMLMGADAFRAMDWAIYEQWEDMMDGYPAMPGDLPDAVLEEYGRLRASGFGDSLYEGEESEGIGRDIATGIDGFFQESFRQVQYDDQK